MALISSPVKNVISDAFDTDGAIRRFISSFNGTTSYIELLADVLLTDDCNIQCYAATLASANSNATTLFGETGSSKTYAQLQTSSGNIKFRTEGAEINIAKTDHLDGKVRRYNFIRSGTRISIEINGVEIGSATGSSDTFTIDLIGALESGSGPSQEYDDELFDIAIWENATATGAPAYEYLINEDQSKTTVVHNSGTEGSSYNGTAHNLSTASQVYDLNTDKNQYENSFYPQLLTNAGDFSDWDATNAPIITAGQTGADGGTSATYIEDNSTSAYEYVKKTSSIFDVTKPYVGSILIKRDSTGRATRAPAFDLHFSGAADEYPRIKIDTSTLDYQVSGTGATGGVSVFSDDYLLAWLSASSLNASNTDVEMRLFPAITTNEDFSLQVTATGSIIVDQPQLEQGSTPTQFRNTTTIPGKSLVIA